jgi:hypothetical protein
MEVLLADRQLDYSVYSESITGLDHRNSLTTSSGKRIRFVQGLLDAWWS